MMKIKITNMETGVSRVANFDGQYEIGKDINGRVCRVACHSVSPVGEFTDRPHSNWIKSSGNKYERAEDG